MENDIVNVSIPFQVNFKLIFVSLIWAKNVPKDNWHEIGLAGSICRKFDKREILRSLSEDIFTTRKQFL